MAGAEDRGDGPEAAGSVFDNLDALRLAPDAAALDGTREVLTRVPVRKPHRQEFVRVHPDPAMSLDTAIFEDKAEREHFIVTAAMRAAMAGELKPVLLMTAVTLHGVVFIWPVPLPDAGGRSNPWWDTAHEAAELAKKTWVRVIADMDLGGYRLRPARIELPEPVWPDLPLPRLLDIAFRGRVIDRVDHPVLKRLRGEA